jgi:hypothetical protein
MKTNKPKEKKSIRKPLALLFFFSPALASAQSSQSFDMELYSAFAVYGFAAFLLIFFSYLMYHAGGDHDEPVKEAVETPAVYAVQNVSTAALQSLNVIYYSVIGLIVLYVITFVIMIL